MIGSQLQAVENKESKIQSRSQQVAHKIIKVIKQNPYKTAIVTTGLLLLLADTYLANRARESSYQCLTKKHPIFLREGLLRWPLRIPDFLGSLIKNNYDTEQLLSWLLGAGCSIATLVSAGLLAKEVIKSEKNQEISC